jgi:hypothetical protein
LILLYLIFVLLYVAVCVSPFILFGLLVYYLRPLFPIYSISLFGQQHRSMVTTNEITISFCRFLSFVWYCLFVFFPPRLRLVHCVCRIHRDIVTYYEKTLLYTATTNNKYHSPVFFSLFFLSLFLGWGGGGEGTSYSGGRDHNHEEGKKIKAGKKWGES